MTTYKRLEKDNFLLSSSEKAYDALITIESNGHGIVFLTNKDGQITASLSDGDIRRWLINDGQLNISSIEIGNKACKSIIYENEKTFQENLRLIHKENPSLNLIPILDKNKKIIWITKIKNEQL